MRLIVECLLKDRVSSDDKDLALTLKLYDSRILKLKDLEPR